MITHYPIWDVSYLVAIIFTLGSIVWCINAFFVWLPLQDPSTEFSGEIADAGGISAFVGATIFEIGSALLMVEAVNENRSDCFGWAVEKVLEEEGVLRFKEDVCSHHHGNRHNLVGRGKRKEKGSEGTSHHILHTGRSATALSYYDHILTMSSSKFTQVQIMDMVPISVRTAHSLPSRDRLPGLLLSNGRSNDFLDFRLHSPPTHLQPAVHYCRPERGVLATPGHRWDRFHHLRPTIHA